MEQLKDRILEIFRQPQLAALATVPEDGRPWVRYVMATGSDDLTVRIASFLNSRKVVQIQKNPEVHLTCGATSPESTESYLQIQGRAEVTTDKAEREAYWKEELQRYFSGTDDPNYCIVRVRPYRIEYMSAGSYEPQVWEA